MIVKTVIDEWLQDYKLPSMFIGTISCDGKCCREAGIPLSVCQNDGWRSRAPIVIDDDELCRRYLDNKLTKAIVFGGLEPLEQYDELVAFIGKLRNRYDCRDDIVIYTGYYPYEVTWKVGVLSAFENVIIKFGRFIPDAPHRYDELLGVELSSDNQYAVKVSDVRGGNGA